MEPKNLKDVITILLRKGSFVEELNDTLYDRLEMEWLDRDMEGPSPSDFSYKIQISVAETDDLYDTDLRDGWVKVTVPEDELE